MVCCVVVAMLFALPFILMRGLYGLVNGVSCSMAWRPASLTVATEGDCRINSPIVDPNRQFTVTDRVKSFRYAGRGAVRLLRFEHSAWIQLSLAAVAILFAVILQISAADWRWIIVACGLVLSLEGLNTAVERTCDRISVAYCGQIKVAKDVAAGAVLLGSIAAALIGLLTFLPYFGSSVNAEAVSVESVNVETVNAASHSLADGTSTVSATDRFYRRFARFHCHGPATSAYSPEHTAAIAAGLKSGSL